MNFTNNETIKNATASTNVTNTSVDNKTSILDPLVIKNVSINSTYGEFHW